MLQEDAAAAQTYIDTCSGAKYQSDTFGWVDCGACIAPP